MKNGFLLHQHSEDHCASRRVPGWNFSRCPAHKASGARLAKSRLRDAQVGFTEIAIRTKRLQVFVSGRSVFRPWINVIGVENNSQMSCRRTTATATAKVITKHDL